MEEPRIFVSHSSADNAFARALVIALRAAGCNVWYDEHNLGHGSLLAQITHELPERPIFLVVLSKAAFASPWVREECEWAYNLYRRRETRIILPVTAQLIEPRDFNTLLFLEKFTRIEAPNYLPYPEHEAIRRTLRALAVPPGDTSHRLQALTHDERVEELLTYGKALTARRNYADAILFFQRATGLVPGKPEAWANLGWALDNHRQYQEALTAYDKALSLDPTQIWIWYNKSAVLEELGNQKEALAAIERLIFLDPTDGAAWNRKGDILRQLNRQREAELAYDRAKGLQKK